MSGIGSLRHRVVIQQPVRSADGGGGASLVWSPVASVWAAVEPLSGQEKALYDGIEASLTHRVTLRYRAGLSPEMRFVHAGRSFDIAAIRNVEERNITLICLCTEVISA